MSGRSLAVAICLALASVALAQSDWIVVPSQIQEFKLLQHPAPVYPQLAKQAHLEGTVRMYVLIARDGTVERIRVIDGHPFLIPAAMDAVKQWQYRPTYRFGLPVRVLTMVSVNFSFRNIPRSPNPSQKPTRV